MKSFITIRLITIILSIVFFLPQTACIVVHQKDNGKHKGWYKNPKNPHHPHHRGPGKSKGRGR